MQLQSVRSSFLTVSLLAFIAAVPALSQSQSAADFNPQRFKAPPAQYRGHAMGSINLTRDTPESLAAEVDQAKQLNYGGLFFEPGGSTSLGLSDAYLKAFGEPGSALQMASSFSVPNSSSSMTPECSRQKWMDSKLSYTTTTPSLAVQQVACCTQSFPSSRPKASTWRSRMSPAQRGSIGNSGWYLYGIGPDEPRHPQTGRVSERGKAGDL